MLAVTVSTGVVASAFAEVEFRFIVISAKKPAYIHILSPKALCVKPLHECCHSLAQNYLKLTS